MNVPLRKSLSAAASFLLVTALDAQAVYLNGDGIGQALIYPYYTAQSADGNPFNTFLSVVNGSVNAKALRVRFREARNGAPVLSFNLFLAPHDVWTGALVPFGSGTRLLSTDLSCTDPPFPIDFAPGALPYLELSNAGYADDGAGDGIERTREGFVEILEMATLAGASADAVTPSTAAGVPGNCAAVRGAATLEAAAPGGSLSGTLTLINVASGMDFTVRADALADLASQPYYRAATDPYPDFSAAEIDAISTVWSDGVSYRSLWNRPIDAVSAVLMRSHWLSEYILDTNTLSRTDVVLTFPTRRFYVTNNGATAPFTKPAMGASCPVGAGETIPIEHVNREARAPPPCCGGFMGQFPPPPPSLCAASTALAIVNGSGHMPAPGASGVLGAASTVFVILHDSNFQNGWLDITAPNSLPIASQGASSRLNGATGVHSGGAHSFSGLPVVGFTVRTFRVNTLPCAAGTCQGNYGGAYPLRFRRTISPAS